MKKHWFNWLSNEGLKHKCGLSKSMDNSCWGDSDDAVRDSSDLAIEKLLNEIEYLIKLKQKILRLRSPEISSISTGSENDSNVRSYGLGIESSTSTNGSDYSENSIDPSDPGSENDNNVRSYGLGIESSTSTNGSDYSENSIDPNDPGSKYRHLWVLCENEKCSGLNYKKFFMERLNVCEHCGEHLKMSNSERIELSIDPGTWEPMDEDLALDPFIFLFLSYSEEIDELFKLFEELLEELVNLFDEVFRELLSEGRFELRELVLEVLELEKELVGEVWSELASSALKKCWLELVLLVLKEPEKELPKEKEFDKQSFEWIKEVFAELEEVSNKKLELPEERELAKQLEESLDKQLEELLDKQLESELAKELDEALAKELEEELEKYFERGLPEELDKLLEESFEKLEEEELEEEPEKSSETETILEFLQKMESEGEFREWVKEEPEEEPEEEWFEDEEELERERAKEFNFNEWFEEKWLDREVKEWLVKEWLEEELLEGEEPYNYKEQLHSSQIETGLAEAVETGIGQINGIPVAFGVMDFRFIGGSMGSVAGEKITRLIESATNRSLPLILVCASGGARMQEGSLSLIQMAKISSALYNYQSIEKSFYISILTSPTTGGVTASFGMLGDLIIAEPHAHIAFAGKRVIEETLKIEVPEGVQVAEYLFEKGLLDLIVERKDLKDVLSVLFQLHDLLPLNQNSIN